MRLGDSNSGNNLLNSILFDGVKYCEAPKMAPRTHVLSLLQSSKNKCDQDQNAINLFSLQPFNPGRQLF